MSPNSRWNDGLVESAASPTPAGVRTKFFFTTTIHRPSASDPLSVFAPPNVRATRVCPLATTAVAVTVPTVAPSATRRTVNAPACWASAVSRAVSKVRATCVTHDRWTAPPFTSGPPTTSGRGRTVSVTVAGALYSRPSNAR